MRSCRCSPPARVRRRASGRARSRTGPSPTPHPRCSGPGRFEPAPELPRPSPESACLTSGTQVSTGTNRAPLPSSIVLIDARGIAPGGRVAADVCIVGTGPAGAVVARELAHRGVDVVVLEGGAQRFGPRQADTYQGETADSHDPLEAVRQKRL